MMSVRIHRKHSPIQTVQIGTESRSVMIRPLPSMLGHSGRIGVDFRTHNPGEPMHSHGFYPSLGEVREFAMGLLELCNQVEGEA